MSAIKVRYPGSFPVFFIGASAGGVSVLQEIAGNLPEDFPAPVFMVLHRRRESKTDKNMMLGLIKNKSRLTVCCPQEGDPVRAGHIYLPSEGLHLGVEDNRIITPVEPDDEEWRPSIDVLFKTGAREYGSCAVCTLLTGRLDDGVEGLKETTYHGGITVAQSPEDAYDPILPLNALLNDHPAYVLPARDMAALFCELAGSVGFDDQKLVAERAAESAMKERAHLAKH